MGDGRKLSVPGSLIYKRRQVRHNECMPAFGVRETVCHRLSY